ncbi:MAG: hypothetical protein ABSH51_28755 [Solirubrobacteraceae bacterium]
MATSATTGRGASAAESAAATRFAAAYVRFLDSAGTTNGLADAASSVRTLAGRAGPIPAARRRGSLVIKQLRPAAGTDDSYLLAARDDAHTFYAQLTLAHQDGRWRVAQLTPPDFVQVLAPAGPPPSAPPPGSTAAENTARVFLQGYLPWLYGQAPLRAITAATTGLLADLKAQPPRVPPTMRSLRPKVAAIAMHRRGLGWQALPNITDGHETYELALTVTHTRGRWRVNNVSSPAMSVTNDSIRRR